MQIHSRPNSGLNDPATSRSFSPFFASILLLSAAFFGFALESNLNAFQDSKASRLNGKVLDQNGKIATECTVRYISFPYKIELETKCNSQGEFSLELEKAAPAFFGLIVTDAAEDNIATFINRRDLRPTFDPTQMIELQLSAAKKIQVKVAKDSKPLANAVVYGMRDSFTPFLRAMTDELGTATLITHKDMPIKSIWAIEGETGSAFWRTEKIAEASPAKVSLDLLPKRHCTATVVDEIGNPIKGLKVVPLVRFDQIANDMILPLVPETQRTTDDKGVATFDFIPAKPDNFFSPNIIAPEYRMVKTSYVDPDHRIVQLKQRAPLFKVTGKVVGAPMDQAGGIEISGKGYDANDKFQQFSAKTDAKGEFTCEVPAGQKFNVIAVGEKWASEEFEIQLTNGKGVQTEPFEIKLKPSTMVEISLTQGDPKQPVKTTVFGIERELVLLDKAPNGKVQRANTSHRFRRFPNENGKATIGLSPGKWTVSANLMKWSEKRSIEIVEGQEPVVVQFHANAIGVKKLAGNAVISDTKSPEPLDQLGGGVITVFDLSSGPKKYLGKIDKDGNWNVEGEFGKDLAVLATSKNKKYAALQFINSSKTKPIKLRMRTAASIEGTLVDVAGKPLPNREISLYYSTFLKQRVHYGSVKTDQNGKFKIEAAIPRISQRLNIKTGVGRFANVGGDLRLKPGEDRKNVRPIFVDYFKRAIAKSKPKKVDPSGAITKLNRTARLAGLRGLVLIHQNTKESKLLAENISNLDSEKLGTERDVMSFLPRFFSTQDFENQDATMKRLLADIDLSKIENGAAAIVLDSNQNVIDRITIADLRSGLPAARRMLAKTKLPQLDAKTEYEKKLLLAKETGRTLFFVEGGPRCGPCFALLDWYDKNRSVMDKHFVLFKFSRSMKNGMEIRKKIRGDELGGIPWHCFLDSSGQKMGTSDGPLGNVGFPAGSKTSIDHFIKTIKQSRKSISDTDLNELRKSLE